MDQSAPIFSEPPVYEALVEFIFPANIDIPSLVEIFRSRFPNERIQQTVQLVVGAGNVPTQAPELPPGVVTHRLFSSDNFSLVNFGPRIFSYNVLQKYPGYEAFRKLVLAECTLLFEHLTMRPQQVALRYLNRLIIPRQASRLMDVLNIDIRLPLDNVRLTQSGLNLVLDCGDNLTAFVDVNVPAAGQGGLAYFNISTISPGDFSMEWLDRAHANARKVFDNLITDAVARLHGAKF